MKNKVMKLLKQIRISKKHGNKGEKHLRELEEFIKKEVNGQ